MGVFESLKNKTFSVAGRTRTSDGQGGHEVGYTAKDAVEGRMRPATSKEREIAQAEGREISHVLFAGGSADVARGDRVTEDGVQYEVMAVSNPSLMDHHLEIECLERQVEEQA